MNNEEKILALLEGMNERQTKTESILEKMQGDISGLKDDVSGLKQGQSNLETEVRELRKDQTATHNYIVAKIENRLEPDVKTLLDGQAAMQDELSDIRTRLTKLPGMERDISALKTRAAM